MTAGGRGRAADGGASERERPELKLTVSGVRPATRLSPEGADGALSSALVETSTGRVLGAFGGDADASLAEFAAALPELLGTPGLARAIVLGRLETLATGQLQDLVLVSPERVHVAQRLARDAGLAVLSVARRGPSIGWIVSEARAASSRA